MFKTIIWATDGSEAADHALPTALEPTGEANGSLLVVHANERLGGGAGGVPVLADEVDLQRKLETKAHDLVESVVNASFHLVSGLNGDPADLIADLAKESDADLIESWPGCRDVARQRHALLHVAPCPVLAVPAKVRFRTKSVLRSRSWHVGARTRPARIPRSRAWSDRTRRERPLRLLAPAPEPLSGNGLPVHALEAWGRALDACVSAFDTVEGMKVYPGSKLPAPA